MPRSTIKNEQFSEAGRAALSRDRRRESTASMGHQRFRNELDVHHRRQSHQRWQRCAEIMRRQAKLAGMRRQTILVVRRMPDGMRPRRQLGEAENGNEKEMAQRIHGASLIGQDDN